MKSNILPIYKKWLATASVKDVKYVDSVYCFCEKHYEAGGDNIVECYSPEAILAEVPTLDIAKEIMGMKISQELDARWGEDSDPEVARAAAFNKI